MDTVIPSFLECMKPTLVVLGDKSCELLWKKFDFIAFLENFFPTAKCGGSFILTEQCQYLSMRAFFFLI